MATIDLGKIKQVWRGTYANGTAYTPDDVVEYTDSGILSSYICIANTTGNAPSSSGTAHGSWNYLAKGGAAGTDLTSTLGTQGQIVYRDGSGLAALNAGTAGQVLQTGGSGANPSWGTVSSDFVKLETQEVTSNAGSVTFKGFANAIYSSYECHITDLQKSGTADNTWKFRWCINNSNLTGSHYRATFHGHHFNSSSSNNENYGGNWNSDSIQMSNWNATDTRQSGYNVNHIILHLGNLSNASYTPTMMYQRLNPHPSGTYTNHDIGGGYWNNSETRIAFGANDGFTIFPNGDNVGKGIFALYGRKK